MPSKTKPRIAFFDFMCCEGCQLTVLELGEKLLDILEVADVVTWREVMSGESESYDIAFCEGSIYGKEDLERIKKIRATARVLVSLGTCACIGCHNALRNVWPAEESLKIVYGSKAKYFESGLARPVTELVPVDYQVQGCPASMPELIAVFKHILSGQEYHPPNRPVCVECKLNDNLCVYEKGIVCLGPVTCCGCNAICTSYGDPCRGCRGLVDEANLASTVKVLKSERLHPIMDNAARKNQLKEEQIRRKFALYNDRPKIGEGGSDER